MSTKSTAVLTRDNEHIYHELSTHVESEDRKYLHGIVFEFSKKNIEILINDEDDLVFEIVKDSDILRFFEKLFYDYAHKVSKEIGIK
jgi:hypothetical protein